MKVLKLFSLGFSFEKEKAKNQQKLDSKILHGTTILVDLQFTALPIISASKNASLENLLKKLHFFLKYLYTAALRIS